MMRRYISNFLVLFFVIMSVLIWFPLRDVQARWENVPPPPSKDKATLLLLGEKQFTYRSNALMLQNMGYGLAKDLSLTEYNYQNLKDWFFLQDLLDPESDMIPMLAAYYYGGVSDPDKLNHIVEYLSHTGQRPIKEKWRWLARAVFLARYEMGDIDKALEISYLMANNKNPNLADWAKQMPAFILAEQGKEEAAYQIMRNILVSEAEDLHPTELYFIRDYICVELLPQIPNEPRPAFCDSIKK